LTTPFYLWLKCESIKFGNSFKSNQRQTNLLSAPNGIETTSFKLNDGELFPIQKTGCLATDVKIL